MKLFASLLLAGAMAMLCRDASSQENFTKPVGYLPVQGVLHDNGMPINGFIDYCWGIFNVASGGTRLATDTNMNMNVPVSNGLANVILNVGDLAILGLSPTQELWLELDVRPSGTTNAFTVLSPRQRIVPSMFATLAVRAEEARRLIEPLSANLMPAVISNLTFTGRPVFGGSTSGPPFVVTSKQTVANLMAECAEYALDAYTLDGYDSSEFWKLEGNLGTVPGPNFLGTLDNQALELKVFNARALRLEPNPIAPNIIAGSAANAITATTEGASILGGHINTIGASAFFSVIGGGAENMIETGAENSIISGGRRNTIQAGAQRSTIGGGATNTIQTLTKFATIGGGVNNSIAADTSWATIGGGQSNVIMNGAAGSTIGGGGYQFISSESGTISGGYSNRVTKDYGVIGGGSMNSIHSGLAAIGGGDRNYIDTNANYSVIGGGDFNRVNPNSLGATIGGGISNTVDQAALYGTVGGGFSNTVGRASATISGGERHLVVALAATIGGGISNHIRLDAKGSTIAGGALQIVEQNVTNGVIAGGLANIIHSNASFSAIGGGRENHVGSTAPFAAIPGGFEARAFNYGQMTHASGGFGNVEGTAQESFYVLRGSTTGAATNELFLNGSSERIRVLPGTTVTFEIQVSARGTGGNAAGYHYRGVIESDAAGVTAFVSTVDTVMTKEEVAAWDVQVVADDVNDALIIRGVGSVLNSVRWVATVRTAEVVN